MSCNFKEVKFVMVLIQRLIAMIFYYTHIMYVLYRLVYIFCCAWMEKTSTVLQVYCTSSNGPIGRVLGCDIPTLPLFSFVNCSSSYSTHYTLKIKILAGLIFFSGFVCQISMHLVYTKAIFNLLLMSRA